MIKRFAGCLAGLAVALACSTLQAASVTFEGMGKKSGVEVVHFGSTKHVSAGQINVKIDGTDFVTYCVDFNHTMKSAWTAEIKPMSTIVNGAAVAYLWQTFAPTATTNTKAAALQVAIWEVMEDFGGAFDLLAGNFKLNGSSSIRTQVMTYIAALPAELGGFTPYAMVLKSEDNPRSQDLILPEPGTLAVIAMGFPLLFGRRRHAIGR